jgi:hypothetical protein
VLDASQLASRQVEPAAVITTPLQGSLTSAVAAAGRLFVGSPSGLVGSTRRPVPWRS